MAIPGERRQTAIVGATNRHRISGPIAERSPPSSIRLRPHSPDRPCSNRLAPPLRQPPRATGPTQADISGFALLESFVSANSVTEVGALRCSIGAGCVQSGRPRSPAVLHERGSALPKSWSVFTEAGDSRPSAARAAPARTLSRKVAGHHRVELMLCSRTLTSGFHNVARSRLIQRN
jgi:hypothetical protein